MDGIEKENEELQKKYDSLPEETQKMLSEEYVKICEGSGCACDWYSFLSQFM